MINCDDFNDLDDDDDDDDDYDDDFDDDADNDDDDDDLMLIRGKRVQDQGQFPDGLIHLRSAFQCAFAAKNHHCCCKLQCNAHAL